LRLSPELFPGLYVKENNHMKASSAITALFLGWLVGFPALAVDEEDLLPPEQAFKGSAAMVDAGTLRVSWEIAKGYYLYGSKLRVRSTTPEVVPGEPELPPGKVKHDEFFGDVEIYRHAVSFEVPLERTGATAEAEFRLTAQGCADVGVCYPPRTVPVRLQLPPLPKPASADETVQSPASPESPADSAGEPSSPLGTGPASPTPSALEALSNLGDSLGLEQQDDEFLPPEQAFRFTARVESASTIVANWVIADGYYLYKERFKFRLEDAPGIELGTPAFPPGKEKEDEFFGKVTTYYHDLDVSLPVQRGDDSRPSEIVLQVSYQGCAEAGLCYPPQRASIPLLLPAGEALAAGPGKPAAPASETGHAASPKPQEEPESSAPGQPEAGPAEVREPVSESDRLAGVLAGGNMAASLAVFFLGGLLLAFTPCVFPMIPILSSIIVGQGHGITTYRAFILSLIYVLAMAVTYTIVGVIAGVAGENLQAMFQNPWVLSLFALLFVLLALSMFGFYELQLPNRWQSKLTELSNRQHGGTLIGVAVMGLLSALIVGPCVAPPLMAALIYIGQSGDAFLGGSALFALSLGMGLPLLVIGTLGGRWLPRAGGWMDAVKVVFGVLLLAVAIWMLERILPGSVALLLWALLFLISAVYLGALEPLGENASGWRRLWKGLGVVIGLYGALLLIGAATGGDDLLRPLRGLAGHASVGAAGGGAAPAEHLPFRRIEGTEGLDRVLREARGKPVMLDFYADWCVSCKEMDKYTFSDPAVQEVLRQGVLLQADVTDNTERDQALLQRFGLIGPPAILFFDSEGQERRGWRFVGYKDAEAFRSHAAQAFGVAP
jgi:thiol:disulfide interchange protein DsbD